MTTTALGSARRLQALAVMGHNLTTVLDYLPRSHRSADVLVTLAQVRCEREHAMPDALAVDVRWVYRTLVQIPGFDHETATMALKVGWSGPAGWDDPDVDVEPITDEPDDWDEMGLAGEFIDELAVRKAIREHDARRLSRAERLEAVRRIGGLDVSAGSLAHQLGLSTNVTRGLQNRLVEIEAKATELMMGMAS